MAKALRKILLCTIICLFCCSGVRANPPASQPAALLAIIDRPRVELSPQISRLADEGSLAKFHFSYVSEANQRVPGILLARQQILSDQKHHPVVIVLHGTGGNKESEIATLTALADHDFIAVSIDGRYHGERGNQADYNNAIAKAFVDGKSHPLYFDTVWDVMRLLDYLQTRGDVDPNRIGLMGISKGGIETWLTAAIDTRVAVAVPCISVQSFQWGLDHDAWHHRVGTFQSGFDQAAREDGIDKPNAAFTQKFYDRVIPGIYSRFDCPQMLPLIAPRPLLVVSGEKDPINPIEGVTLCRESTTRAYAAAGAADHFKLIIEPGAGHTVTKQSHAAAVDWFTTWLKPAAE